MSCHCWTSFGGEGREENEDEEDEGEDGEDEDEDDGEGGEEGGEDGEDEGDEEDELGDCISQERPQLELGRPVPSLVGVLTLKVGWLGYCRRRRRQTIPEPPIPSLHPFPPLHIPPLSLPTSLSITNLLPSLSQVQKC